MLLLMSIGGSKGGHQGCVPPSGPNSFIFMQFSAKSVKSNLILGVGIPPQENPGSATDELFHLICHMLISYYFRLHSPVTSPSHG